MHDKQDVMKPLKLCFQTNGIRKTLLAVKWGRKEGRYKIKTKLISFSFTSIHTLRLGRNIPSS
jgi:hypothetical protein